VRRILRLDNPSLRADGQDLKPRDPVADEPEAQLDRVSVDSYAPAFGRERDLAEGKPTEEQNRQQAQDVGSRGTSHRSSIHFHRSP
jgi:hypothetical protein